MSHKVVQIRAAAAPPHEKQLRKHVKSPPASPLPMLPHFLFSTFICSLSPPTPQPRPPRLCHGALSLLSIIITVLIPKSYRPKLKCVVASVCADVLGLSLGVARLCLAPRGAEINCFSGGLALA